MVGCAVFNCVSNSSREQKDSFYKLPRTDKNIKIGKGKKPKDDYDNEQAKKWKNFCKRKNLPKDRDFHICHKHFSEDAFKRDLQVRNNSWIYSKTSIRWTPHKMDTSIRRTL